MNKIIVKIVELLPKKIVKIFAQKYIAGEEITDAINLVKSLNAKGILATVDVLGEAIKNKDEAENAFRQCMSVYDAIEENNLKANLSIKPTQLGLGIDEDFAYGLISTLAKRAKEMNNFLRIDMENSPYTDLTFRLYNKLRSEFNGSVGVVVQAYLKRTFDDVIELTKSDSNFRLCKGIYVEPASIAYKDRQQIRDNFIKVLRYLLENNVYVGIATHDDYLISESYNLIKELNIPTDRFEFQMLLGVREDLRDKINRDGYKIRIYVPFGKDWYAYSIRRLKENNRIAGYIFANLFSFKKQIR